MMQQRMYEYLEIERLYTQTICRGIRSIAVTAASRAEGTTTVAVALAQRCVAANLKTLLVDFNLLNPTPPEHLLQATDTLIEPDHTLQRLAWQPTPESSDKAIVTLAHCDISFLPAPVNSQKTLPFREPSNLKQCLQHWLNLFDVVVIDTSPVNAVNRANIPAETVAASCDGVVLVTLAGMTPAKQVIQACDKLQQAKAAILGAVFNNQYNPTLKHEMLREAYRLQRVFPRLGHWLVKRLQHADMLNGY